MDLKAVFCNCVWSAFGAPRTDGLHVILIPDEPLAISGIAFNYWTSYATLIGVGVFYPVKMLPLVFLLLFYKAVGVLEVYLPMHTCDVETESAESFLWICVVAIILDVIAIY